jgi:putative DNA primase/helicase
MVRDITQQTKGRARSILIALGFPESSLSGKHGACIALCKGGKDRARWWPEKEWYYCSQCGTHDLFDLAMDKLNMNFKEVADEIRKIIGGCKVEEIKQPDIKKNEDRLKKIHSGLKKITEGDPVNLYLKSRGITIIPKEFFYHPGIDYWNDGASLGKYPAMVCRMQDINGKTITYKIIYLNEDGSKIAHTPQKKDMPPILPMIGGSYRIGEISEDILAVCEGIESGLMFYEKEGYPVWCAGNAQAMKTIELPDNIKCVYILADSDTNFVGQAAAYELARKLRAKDIQVRVVNIINLQSKVDDSQAKFIDYYDSGCDMDILDYYNREKK